MRACTHHIVYNATPYHTILYTHPYTPTYIYSHRRTCTHEHKECILGYPHPYR